MSDGDDMCMEFSYRGHEFCIKESGRRFVLRMLGSVCPSEGILLELQSHFAGLLSPKMRD
jgi:hypothetical protein